jgi:hypothetical protein
VSFLLSHTGAGGVSTTSFARGLDPCFSAGPCPAVATGAAMGMGTEDSGERTGGAEPERATLGGASASAGVRTGVAPAPSVPAIAMGAGAV